MAQNPEVALKLIPPPSIGSVVSAPPVLRASGHTTDFTCGKCGTIPLRADEGQVHNLQIHCTQSDNTTDI
jgi:hypothetical protein